VLIARGQTIAGVDIVELRRVLRCVMGAVFTSEGVAGVIAGPATEAAALFATLEREGLIEAGADRHAAQVICGADEDLDDAVLWRATVAGNALAKARIGKPMRRGEAERLLAGVLTRAGQVNDDPTQVFRIESIELFGSLANSDADVVGDIDLRALVSHRFDGDAYVRELERRWHGNLLDALTAASRQLHRFLTGGSHRIDLQLDEITAHPLPEGTTPVVIYRRGDTTAPS